MAPGFIMSKFHTKRMKRTKKEIKERIKLIPLKRGGTTQEFAGAVLFLLSETAAYITGEILTLSGGDWL
jgi:NAD(P)-dependent dehydrogenase (short-subunit alcohol dehydrogenase family)